MPPVPPLATPLLNHNVVPTIKGSVLHVHVVQRHTVCGISPSRLIAKVLSQSSLIPRPSHIFQHMREKSGRFFSHMLEKHGKAQRLGMRLSQSCIIITRVEVMSFQCTLSEDLFQPQVQFGGLAIGNCQKIKLELCADLVCGSIVCGTHMQLCKPRTFESDQVTSI